MRPRLGAATALLLCVPVLLEAHGPLEALGVELAALDQDLAEALPLWSVHTTRRSTVGGSS